jgi:hypothetical protein
MKPDLIRSLIKIADQLDRGGHNKLADDIDLLITNSSSTSKANWRNKFKAAMEGYAAEEVDIEIPEEEMELLQEVLKSLEDSLQ